MKRLIVLSLTSICILLTGCKRESHNQENTDMIFIPQDKITTIEKIAFDDAKFIDSCVFIPLETSETGLIGEISQIETCNNNYYILDKKTEKLKVFDSAGKFLFDIGAKGDAPGEYNSINSFFVNENEKKIGIFDPLRLVVHEYNLNGKYIQTVKHNQKALISINKSFCTDDHIYCFLNVSHENYMIYATLSTKDYSIIDSWSPYPVKVNMQMIAEIMKHPFSLVNGELHYTSLYTDTIYSYNNGKKQPYLLIETGKPNISPTYFEGKSFEHEPTDADFEVMKDKKHSPGFNNLLETDRYLMTSYRFNSDFYIVDKDRMEVFHALEAKDFYLDFIRSTSISGNKLINILSQESIPYYQDYIKNRGDKFPAQISDLMSKEDVDEDNPILIIYHMKKSEK